MTSQTTPLEAKVANNRTRLGQALFVIVLVLFGNISAHAQQAETMQPEQLVTRLQQGGLILYVRHAATDHSQSDTDLSDFSKCSLQRNLSAEGKQESRDMGTAIRALGIPVGKVLSSPYCRCIDTAKNAFGRYEIRNDMQATFYTDIARTQEFADFLRTQISTKPAPGMNTVLVGHTANLRDVTEVWPKPEGVVHVFEPLGAGKFRHLGRILPTDWPHLYKIN